MGALILGLLLFNPRVSAFVVSAGVGDWIFFAWVTLAMVSPLIGAALVLRLQPGVSWSARHQVLRPYAWWAVVGMAEVAALTILAASEGRTGPIWNFVQWSETVIGVARIPIFFLVPIAIPLVRGIASLVLGPPRLHADDAAPITQSER